jgi:TolB protein
MAALPRAVRSPFLPAVLLVTAAWSTAPYARQVSANDGFMFFTSDRAFPSTAGMCVNCEDIYAMSPDGTNAVRLTFGGGLPADAAAYSSGGADWSHSKKLVAFQSNRVNRVPQIYLMNADGSEQQRLVSLPGGAAFPSFSPNGNELCFHSQTMPRDIYIVNVHGTGLTNLTSPEKEPGQPGASGDNIRCDWSPKGDAIAFTSSRDGNQEIYVIDADGTNLRRLTTAAGSDANPAFSPKGDLIAFESNRDGTPEIYVMKADGSDQERLTDFSAAPTPSNVAVSKPTWSPLGDRLAFHRRVAAQGQRGHLEVYTINADGEGVRQITNTASPGFSGFPSWAKWSAKTIGR